MQITQPPVRRQSILGPMLLIGLGVVVLLGNLGILGWSVWEVVFRLWPVLLIAGGLEILIGRRYLWAAWVIALTTMVIFAGAIWFLPSREVGMPFTGTTITQPLGAAQRARIDIGFGAGTLKLATMDTITNLVEARVERRANEDIEQDLRVTDGTALYTLRSHERMPWMGQTGRGPTWDIRLNRHVPTELTIATGAGQSTLDLRRMQLTQLDISTGAGQSFVTLPESGVLDASMSMGAGQTVITIPTGMAARIQISAGVGSRQVQGDFQRDGDYYVSPDYATATNRVNLDVSGGIGNFVVTRETAKR